MKNVKSMNLREVQQTLEQAGFKLVRCGKHLRYKHLESGKQISLPKHPGAISKKIIVDVVRLIA